MSQPQFAGPGFYRIVAQGHLTPGMHGLFGSMQVVDPRSRGESSLAVLEGRVSDQAELSGILNTLYELRFSLLSVNSLDDGPGAASN